ncbi:hypothetical protein RRG08_004424 [Elysia crispata]|uniref:Uncharacterized protein n=1 Tax=Elysia crispata TaxID=231223 RepID=A0AAE0Y5Z5_9GAST|nr:hypothetical protein RRG08_004424 [Elysia crispata]
MPRIDPRSRNGPTIPKMSNRPNSRGLYWDCPSLQQREGTSWTACCRHCSGLVMTHSHAHVMSTIAKHFSPVAFEQAERTQYILHKIINGGSGAPDIIKIDPQAKGHNCLVND